VLRWILQRLLAKDPEGRYASTNDLLADLRAAGTRLSETLTPVAPGRRFPLRPNLIGVAVALCCVAAAVPFVRTRQQPPTPLNYVPFATDACREKQPAWSPDGRTLAYVCDVDGVDQIFTRALDANAPARLTQGSTPAARSRSGLPMGLVCTPADRRPVL
jgi:hypothetical protein